jgi:hypothetical protein
MIIILLLLFYLSIQMIIFIILAGVNPRIVMVTLQPPTYEIFTMVSRVALISVGHLMYSGRRRNMLPYFSSADYPCPAFKNPSDYYRKLNN